MDKITKKQELADKKAKKLEKIGKAKTVKKEVVENEIEE